MIEPTLALIPSAYKGGSPKGTLYSVLPSNGVGDFDFERAGEATRINKDGLIETVASNIPRLNYPMIDGEVSGCPSLLLEPTRTNYVSYSNDFIDSSWLPTDATVVSGIISPDGTSNAFTLSNTAVNGIIQKAVSLTGLRVVSIFAKKGTHRYLYIGAYGGTGSYANFDLENGVVTNGANANIEDYGNGWFRCICHSADGATGGVQIFPSNNTIGPATTNGSIQIYGAQLEQGSYPTSYIPTQGSIGTRVAESCNGAGNEQVFNDSEGVLFAEISPLNENGRIALNDGTVNNNVRLVYSSSLNLIDAILFNGINQVSLSYFLPTRGAFNKIAFKYKENDFALWVDGIEVDSQVGSGTTFTSGTLSELDFDAGSNGLVPFYGNTKQIQYFDSALTDEELAALTS